MAGRLVKKFKQQIAELTLVPSSGGCFEITLDGKLVYSKLDTGLFPDEDEILALVERELGREE